MGFGSQAVGAVGSVAGGLISWGFGGSAGILPGVSGGYAIGQELGRKWFGEPGITEEVKTFTKQLFNETEQRWRLLAQAKLNNLVEVAGAGLSGVIGIVSGVYLLNRYSSCMMDAVNARCNLTPSSCSFPATMVVGSALLFAYDLLSKYSRYNQVAERVNRLPIGEQLPLEVQQQVETLRLGPANLNAQNRPFSISGFVRPIIALGVASYFLPQLLSCATPSDFSSCVEKTIKAIQPACNISRFYELGTISTLLGLASTIRTLRVGMGEDSATLWDTARKMGYIGSIYLGFSNYTNLASSAVKTLLYSLGVFTVGHVNIFAKNAYKSTKNVQWYNSRDRFAYTYDNGVQSATWYAPKNRQPDEIATHVDNKRITIGISSTKLQPQITNLDTEEQWDNPPITGYSWGGYIFGYNNRDEAVTAFMQQRVRMEDRNAVFYK